MSNGGVGDAGTGTWTAGTRTQGQRHDRQGHTGQTLGHGQRSYGEPPAPHIRCSMSPSPFGHIAGVPVSRCPSCPCCPHHGQIKIEIGRPPFPRVQQNTAMDIFSDPPSKPAFPPAYTGAKKRSTKAWRAWAGDHPEDAKVFNESMTAYYAERKAWWKEVCDLIQSDVETTCCPHFSRTRALINPLYTTVACCARQTKT